MDTEKILEDVTGRVREALDKAEARAKKIVGNAEDRAKDLIAEAEAEAGKIRDRGESEAQERLVQVREALTGIEGTWGGAKAAAPSGEVDPQPAVWPQPTPPVEPEPLPPAEPEPMPPEPEIEPPAPAQPDREAPQATDGFSSERSHDATAARIVATKMALDGSSRDEISEHLDHHYDVDASEKLLDDVMARAKR